MCCVLCILSSWKCLYTEEPVLGSYLSLVISAKYGYKYRRANGETMIVGTKKGTLTPFGVSTIDIDLNANEWLLDGTSVGGPASGLTHVGSVSGAIIILENFLFSFGNQWSYSITSRTAPMDVTILYTI